MEVNTELKKRSGKIIKLLANEYPEAKIALDYKTPFQLLVATILSAQCTDIRVNIVTKELFKNLKTPDDFIKVPVEQLEEAIFSTGFYRAKAKNIKAASIKIVEKFKGNVPETMDELLSLPGVGRKTANVVLGHCFKPVGIVVDTHVIRLSNRLGFVESKNPEIIEKKLMEFVPKSKWTIFTHYIINHGRKICSSRKPKCDKCVISKHCPSAFID